jgi:hypothetical protein
MRYTLLMAQRSPNPYRPGFNQPPSELAGREEVLSAAREALDVAVLDGRTPRPLLLVGTRGVGKTVLLGEIAATAAALHSWPSAAVEVRPGGRFVDRLAGRLAATTALFEQSKPGRRFRVTSATLRAGAVGLGAEVNLSAEPPTAALSLEAALTATCAAAEARSSGLVVAVDELQLADRGELAEFTATLQEHVVDGWPLVVVAAGLPSLREPRRSVTYLERGEWHELGLLDGAATLRALTAPASSAGRPFEEAAAHLLVQASGGYPYAIQVLGHHAWRASTGSARIGLADAQRAVAAAEADLAAGLYAARWSDASATERTYLSALARLVIDGAPHTGADVAAALDRKPQAVSYLRDRLLKKGTIFAEGRNLHFVVPGLAQWVLESGGVWENAGPVSH